MPISGFLFHQSESARLALCEHAQWTPVVVMLGLLQCSIPPVLKAELLETLAAFGKSPEIAAPLWQSLEYTQVRPFKTPHKLLDVISIDLILW